MTTRNRYRRNIAIVTRKRNLYPLFSPPRSDRQRRQALIATAILGSMIGGAGLTYGLSQHTKDHKEVINRNLHKSEIESIEKLTLELTNQEQVFNENLKKECTANAVLTNEILVNQFNSEFNRFISELEQEVRSLESRMDNTQS